MSKFSVIMTVYDQARELEEQLPAYLKQTYEPGYEVIVVDESSTDETPDVLKLLKNDYPHLYSTFLPKPNRRVVRKKQAFNVGIKAAKNEWIIITKLTDYPLAEDVLQAISKSIGDSPLTLGYHLKKGIRLEPFYNVDDIRNHILRSAIGVKNSPANVGDIRDMHSVPGSGRLPGGEHGNPLQHSCSF